MRYYDARRERVIALPRARLRFFLLGPFYLLWQRLWLDAVLCALLIWGVIRMVLFATASIMPVNGRPSMQAVLDAYAAFQNAAARGVPADQALRDFVTASIPFYAMGFTLALLMAGLTYLLPAYLDWRFRARGYVQLRNESDAGPIIR